jgi:hypothetical protein
MKITIKPAHSETSFILDGEPNELETILHGLMQTNTSEPVKNSPSVVKTKTVNSADPIVIKPSPFANSEAFLNSLYVYQASSTNDSGKGRYIAEVIMDGNIHLESDLVEKLKTSRKVIASNVKRLRSGGAVVDTSDGMIQVMSIPTNKRFVRKRRTVKNASATKNTNKKVIHSSSLQGFKLS